MHNNTQQPQSLLQALSKKIPPDASFLQTVQAIRSLGGDFADFLQDKDFAGSDLSGVDLTGAELDGANFIEAYLEGTLFNEASLQNADFLEAELQKAQLKKANLKGAKLHQAILDEADLSGATIRGAELLKAKLNGAILEATDLRSADLKEAQLEKAQLQKADLRNASLQNANLSEANLKGADCRNANFENANLRRATLDNTRLQGAILKGVDIDPAQLERKPQTVWEIINQPRAGRQLKQVNLSSENLREANLKKAILNQANLSETVLQEADLTEAQLSGAILTDANLREANLTRANLSSANLAGAGLREAILKNANLNNADLTNAQLAEANLSGADLRGANLAGADLREANLQNTDLRNTNWQEANLEAANLTGARRDNLPIPKQTRQPVSKTQELRFVIGAIPDQESQELEKIYGSLGEYLAEQFNQSQSKHRVQVVYEAVENYQAAVERLRSGTLDMVWFGGVTGWLAQQQVPQIMAIAQRDIDAHFRSVFIARQDHGIPSIEGDDPNALTVLRSKKITFGDPLSTSGAIMPLFYLKQAGFSAEDLAEEDQFSGSHDATIERIKSGEFDVGVLNQQVWESRQKDPNQDLDDIVEIWRSPEFCDYHWAIHREASKRFKELFDLALPTKVQAFLTKIDSSASEQHKEILRLFGASKFIPAGDEDYTIFEGVLKEVKDFLPSSVKLTIPS